MQYLLLEAIMGNNIHSVCLYWSVFRSKSVLSLQQIVKCSSHINIAIDHWKLWEAFSSLFLKSEHLAWLNIAPAKGRMIPSDDCTSSVVFTSLPF